ncbi:MAG: MGH1-like glycoside hydrolase domain-containing protein [Lacipirellulaceae bacterium]
MAMDKRDPHDDTERQRLAADAARSANWKRWGPYLPERQWGTVREDYSGRGDAWGHFTHAEARSRAYRWGEDGLLGWCDRQCRLCFGVALWNGRDPILKERLFGLTGPEGNHGEDVKEAYYYLDSTPTHSYARALYRYPQGEFPYQRLLDENRNRGRDDREFELLDTGVFDEQRYWDVYVEYAKDGPDETLVRLTLKNRGPDPAELWVLPTFWFRNTWSWGCRHEGCTLKPTIVTHGGRSFETSHETLGRYDGQFGPTPPGSLADHAEPQLLFTDNETNSRLLFGVDDGVRYAKDAFHRWVIDGETAAVNPRGRGTKVAAVYRLNVAAGGEATLTAVLRPHGASEHGATEHGVGDYQAGDERFTKVFAQRKAEADAFYASIVPPCSAQHATIARQAYGGLLWSKQFYHYIVHDWLEGDRDVATPPVERKSGRNSDWGHVYARDVLSVPDKWEYPWFAAWDLAFHAVPLARVDPEFAKGQLLLLLREWYSHPNGQLPAYEWNFHDVNPPVHAWACLHVYRATATKGRGDRRFLAEAFQRLLLNFTWWVNRVDALGDNVFGGGFLGLDNIGVFDRSQGLPSGARLEQADGTAWMAFYCLSMLSIALELAREDPAYEDMASKFLDHFVRISDAMNAIGGGLWDEEDGFYYDRLQVDGQVLPLRVRSLVGLLPLVAVETFDTELIESLPGFKKRLDWFLRYRADLKPFVSLAESSASGATMLLAAPSSDRLRRALQHMLDEAEFLSPFGVRSLSKRHADTPFEVTIRGETSRVPYTPGESDSGLFGGNSNWRGPIWFPVNFLLIEALRKYHAFYGDSLQVEFPTGSGRRLDLAQVARELNTRLVSLFVREDDGVRPCHGQIDTTPGAWNRYPLFYEYFHGDTGEGLGASHQTGWTALVATCMDHFRGNGR